MMMMQGTHSILAGLVRREYAISYQQKRLYHHQQKKQLMMIRSDEKESDDAVALRMVRRSEMVVMTKRRMRWRMMRMRQTGLEEYQSMLVQEWMVSESE